MDGPPPGWNWAAGSSQNLFGQEKKGVKMIEALRTSFGRWTLLLKTGVLFFCLSQLGWWLYRWLTPESFTKGQFLAGLIVDGIGLMFLLLSMCNLFCLFSARHQEELFSSSATQYARRAFIWFLVWNLYTPLERTLTGLIETINNPVGQRELAIYFEFDDFFLIRIIVLAGLALLAFVIQQGTKLHEEQSLTV
jgi:hypothetical protein